MGDGYFNTIQIESGLLQCKPVVTNFHLGTASGVCLKNIKSVQWNGEITTFSTDLTEGGVVLHVSKPFGGSNFGTLNWGPGGSDGFSGGGFFTEPESYTKNGCEDIIGIPFQVCYKSGLTFSSPSGSTKISYFVTSSDQENPPNTTNYRILTQYTDPDNGSPQSFYYQQGEIATFPTGCYVTCSVQILYVIWQSVPSSSGYLLIEYPE